MSTKNSHHDSNLNTQILETDRLQLRMLTDEMYQEILTQWTDDEIMNFLDIKPENLEKEKSRSNKGYATFNKALLIFQLIEKTSGRIIGWCGYHSWYTDHDRAEIGYSLSYDDVKNKGFMTEALHAVIKYGFDTMHLNRIEALVGPDNVPSLQLMKKFGFKQEGHLRQHYFTNGKYDDSVLFSLLYEDY